MFRRRFFASVLALTLAFGCAAGVRALEVDSGAVYCFSSGDFAREEEEPLLGVCIMDLPETGAVLLGQRVVRPGDILTAGQLDSLTFEPARTETDEAASVSYLPIYENRVEPEAVLTISIRGREDKAPVAEDFGLETYKNIPNEGRLKVTDPEGQAMTYTLVRQPRRGTVEIREDGSFLYTPKKNKVGVDSFTFTATDPAGKVSREATVTVRILKPEEAAQYTDTAQLDCRFEAEWLRQTGIFTPEQMGGSHCFQPEKPVTRGQFLAMVTKLLELDVQEQPEYTQLAQQAPQWLRPYLAAAVRSGIAANWRLLAEEEPNLETPITGAEAALIFQNALDLPTVATMTEEAEPDWEEMALAVMGEQGLTIAGGDVLTRAEAAKLLYQVSRLLVNAPGMAALRH